MPVVDHIDYTPPSPRIYLHADTVNSDVDTLDVYREIRALRRTNESHRKFDPVIVAGGNVEKIPGVSYTLPYVQLLHGCRIIPYGGVDHKIRVIRDTFTDDGLAGTGCFDRSSLSVEVDIDIDFSRVEVRIVSTGSSLTQEEHDQLMSLPTAEEILDTET